MNASLRTTRGGEVWLWQACTCGGQSLQPCQPDCGKKYSVADTAPGSSSWPCEGKAGPRKECDDKGHPGTGGREVGGRQGSRHLLHLLSTTLVTPLPCCLQDLPQSPRAGSHTSSRDFQR